MLLIAPSLVRTSQLIQTAQPSETKIFNQLTISILAYIKKIL